MNDDFEREMEWIFLRSKGKSFDECAEKLGYIELECLRCELSYLQGTLRSMSDMFYDLKMTVLGMEKRERNRNESN